MVENRADEDLIIPVGDTGTDPASVVDEVRDVVTAHYDLGTLKDVWPISGGYINWSFGVLAESKDGESRFFVRKYNKSTAENAVRYEHALVDHLIGRGFAEAAPVLRTHDGSSYVTRRETDVQGSVPRFFAVYGFLPGEDKYSWCFNTEVTDEELVSCAQTLARYHACVSDFDPGNLERKATPGGYPGNGAVPPIMEHLSLLAPIYRDLAGRPGDDAFSRYLREKLELIVDCVTKSIVRGDELREMPVLAVHSDFHAGNMKYIDGHVVALFDFDYSRMDYRMFDIGHALHFFCFSWRPESDGGLWLDKLDAFLRAYQRAARELSGVGPLSPVEAAHVVPFLHAGNIFTLDWDIQDFFAEPGRDVDEYLLFLRHNVRMMETIEANREAIERVVAEAQHAR